MIAAGKYTAPELRLLQLLSRCYPTITAAHIEMINLHAGADRSRHCSAGSA